MNLHFLGTDVGVFTILFRVYEIEKEFLTRM